MNPGVAIDVLIPTCNRACALAVTLAALSAQTMRRFRIIISDQSDMPGALGSAEVAAVLRYLAARDIAVEALRHLPRRGMAEQRAFLLSRSEAPYCLFLDDDVIVEPDLLERLHKAMVEKDCGFVGSALHGLSYLFDQRPQHQEIEWWDAGVEPERILPGTAAWERHHLHSAANLFHVQQRLALEHRETRCYRVAWVGGCVLFDSDKLRAAGGFDFWRELPPEHCGEDVLAQLRVMARFGGCGIIPSGAYHMELPTTIARREVDAPKMLWQ
ncbi:glycosyltransferase family 2 protein [Massilia sp. TSP1-1-2]|uniref:glycosyltransferase family 2 protein n=1 Tax=Massilia sp. TSP1-1-2 TaxID=2804649 RepID=UPI003CE6CD88